MQANSSSIVPRTNAFPKHRLGTRIGFAMALTCTSAHAAGLPAVAHPSEWPGNAAPRLSTPDVEAAITALLGTMTLEDKVGQMVQADIDSIKPSDLAQYHLGSILAGGFAAPNHDLEAAPAEWLALIDSYKRAAIAGRPKGHAPIPILFGIDAVHGNGKIRGATVFPHNVGLGAAHDPALIKRIGEATAQEAAAIGVDWAFAPTVAVARDVRWGRSYESYSDDPQEVGDYASNMVTGLQGAIGTADFLSSGHVLSSAKHFIGDGGTTNGRDQGDTAVPETVLRDVHGAGYRAALAAGVTTVMASYSSWNGEKSHANQSLMTGVLKQRWGFDGFIVGDWNAQEELPGCTRSSCPGAVNAGLDMVMAPDSWKEMVQNLLQQARAGTISQSRLDDAVRRILRVKAAAGLIFAAPGAQHRFGDFTTLGSPDHRMLAREAVRKSLVLLKNDDGLLPLKGHQNVLVIGAAADSIGTQCGGWTVDWQGRHHTNAELPGATSIYGGIKAAVENAGGTAVFSADGSFKGHPDVAIFVYGEEPYAEFQGDLENLVLPHGDDVTAILRQLKQKAIPVVSVLLSGRPLWVNPQLNLSKAFVAAWLPGSEGEGVADLLFRGADGRTDFDFTGRLSFPWSATGMPVTYTPAGQVSGALFARGYGLDLQQKAPLGRLSENPQVPSKWNTHGVFYGEGHVIAPWSIYVADKVAEVRMTGAGQVSPGDVLKTWQAGSTVDVDWIGGSDAIWRIGGREVDLSAPKQAAQSLTIRYHLTQAPTAAMFMGAGCGQTCTGWIDVTHALSTSPGWQTVSLPLACFVNAGANLHDVETVLALKTAGKASIAIDQVSLTPTLTPDRCPGA